MPPDLTPTLPSPRECDFYPMRKVLHLAQTKVRKIDIDVGAPRLQRLPAFVVLLCPIYACNVQEVAAKEYQLGIYLSPFIVKATVRSVHWAIRKKYIG
jgi:hypothetical protein